VSWQRLSTYWLYQSHRNCRTHGVFFSHPNSFRAIINTGISTQLSSHSWTLESVSSISAATTISETRLNSDSILLHWTLRDNHFARTEKKTPFPITRFVVFTDTLLRNGFCYCCVRIHCLGNVFISNCLAKDVSDFTIPAFGRHVTIYYIRNCNVRVFKN
jgi:hypothetical protein